MSPNRWILCLALVMSPHAVTQETHVHGTPENLGQVTFAISCRAAVQPEFNRGVALLHSFAYAAAESAFRDVARQDPQCAMAHWGMAMTRFHELWEPPILSGSVPAAQEEIKEALNLAPPTERERKFIRAAELVFRAADKVPYSERAAAYEKAMAGVAAENREDVEAQTFYALALLANASPTDKTHRKQKQAAALLETLYRAHPQHPGLAHYLIHACDNAEMAPRGLEAARAYSRIAPSAPHALHMPSHIFTRLGLWEDSIASNTAAKEAAHRAGDIGEELHSMDYLVYAYLQKGRDADAEAVILELKAMPSPNVQEFKIAYAATAMPIRYVVERHRWTEAAGIGDAAGAPPQVVAIAVWARGLGLARGGRAAEAGKQVDELERIERQLEIAGATYWATQVRVMKREVAAWSAQAEGRAADAATLLRQAADEEDAVEKLPVTPGPIVPAREQLGELLLEQGQAEMAATEFRIALTNAPGRHGALAGAGEAAQRRSPQ